MIYDKWDGESLIKIVQENELPEPPPEFLWAGFKVIVNGFLNDDTIIVGSRAGAMILRVAKEASQSDKSKEGRTADG